MLGELGNFDLLGLDGLEELVHLLCLGDVEFDFVDGECLEIRVLFEFSEGEECSEALLEEVEGFLLLVIVFVVEELCFAVCEHLDGLVHDG